ncbi:BppU family phage baseplate upper protein [Clostridium perfringens]
MKEIKINVDNYNENSIKTIEGDNLSEVYKIYICKNKRRIDLTNKIAIMAYVNEYGNKKSDILALNITNASQGEIELPITNVISSENGVYACQIAIYGENNSLEQTAPFSLIVENNIFSKISNTAINSTDFHILSEAIKTTNSYAEKLKQGTENIELQYADKLNNKMNRDDILSMANMGQDVKEAMTNGSVAVVGENTILEENIVNKQVTPIKLSDKVNLKNYPFASETEYVEIKDGILEFESYNSKYKDLYLERVYRKCDLNADGSNIVTSINIKNNNEIIAQINESNYIESDIIERIKLNNLKSDNAEYYITINWSKYKINDFSQKNLTVNQTKFHVNTYKKTDFFNKILDAKTSEYVEISMPSVCYGMVGQEFNIYFDNIIMCNNLKDYQIDVWCDKGKQLEECFRIVPDVEEEIGIRILVYKDYNKNKKLAEKLVLLKVKSNKNIRKNGILMGDSITDFNIYPPELKKLMPNVNFIGTRGESETCKHEGRGGWTSNDYITLQNKGSVQNAFYNPTTHSFDFQYYCESNNLQDTVIDFFVIELGINDVAQGYEIPKIIENYNKIITSVTTYRPNCKVIIDLTLPPVGGQDGFGCKNDAKKTRWEQKILAFNLVKELIKQYDYKTSRNIYINSINLNLDTVNNFPTTEVQVNSRNKTLIKRFNENVHPAESGFYQIADSSFYCLNYIFS